MRMDAFTAASRALKDGYCQRIDNDLARNIRSKWLCEHNTKSFQRESHIDDISIVAELWNAVV